jgi:hypothetical protein
MRLYADFDLLNGGGGPSGLAHRLLVEAGYRVEVEYVPYGRPCAELVGHTERTPLPVLVLPHGNVIASLPGILDWLAAQAPDDPRS